MCRGYFLNDKPTISALVRSKRFPKINPVRFLIDTGADNTALSLIDILRLGVMNVSEISDNTIDVAGISGRTTAYIIEDDVELIFVDYSNRYSRFSVHIEILPKIYVIPTLPISILGRDFLNRFEISYNKLSNEIILKRNDFAEGLHYCFSL